jgi:hypothetical protein
LSRTILYGKRKNKRYFNNKINMKELRFKKWSPELTLDLKEIMLNAEWYYKVSNKKTTDAFLITLYALATVWIVFTIHTIYILIK